MHYQALIHHYGYILLFLAMCINFTTLLVFAGIAAHLGYMSLLGSMVAVCVGSIFFAELYFFIGRRGAARLIARHEHWQEKMDYINHRVEHYHSWFIFSYRFILGFRMISAFIVGMSHIPWRSFVVFDVMGAVVWTVVFVLAGYFFGALIKMLMKDAQNYEWYAVVAVVVIGAVAWCMRHYYKRYKKRKKLQAAQEG